MFAVNKKPAAGRSQSDHRVKGEPATGSWSRGKVLLLAAALSLGGWPGVLQAQLQSADPGPARTQPGTPQAPADASLAGSAGTTGYTKPTEATKLRNYLFSAFGPYPIVGAAFAAGISQAGNGIPEWGQGAEGYGKRMGSNFGIAAVSTTTRYALSAAFKEDAVYYPCECKGTLPRLRHAVFSSVTARRGEDGHRVFSFPAIVAPYVGSATAVYGWYPDRYSAKDAFRMGNYSLLANVGGNIAMEFLFRAPNSWLSKLRLNAGPVNNGQAGKSGLGR
ncbi:hypothetical protein [Paludibaculum fermentans]|uniref:hypothetical protein n=1 Tax=Paludibaculum fermentans TaxID=1473598 RepID=UPI003EBA3AC3